MATVNPEGAVIRVGSRSYTPVVHEAEEGGFWAEIVELPGCVSQGETLIELGANLREAVEAVLAAEN